MAEEVTMTLEELGERHRRGDLRGWEAQLYDYGRNRWDTAEEALGEGRADGRAYERAVLRDRGGRTVRVRLVPGGRSPLRVAAASAGDVGLWDALGVRMRANELAAMRRAVEGREGPMGLDELDAALAALERAGGEEGAGASGARRALATADARGRGDAGRAPARGEGPVRRCDGRRRAGRGRG